MLELYHNNVSVCAQKVRIVLAEKNVPWTGHHLSLARGEHLTAEFKAMNPRGVVPVLVRIVEESEPFGPDHAIVLEALGALTQVGDDQAVPALTTLMRRKKLFARKKARALKEGSLAALRSIKTAGAQRAIEEAGRTGDRMLKKLVRETGAGT